MKNRGVAILLAVYLGGLGVHKFYVGKIGQGILYLVFCWTFIPQILSFVDAIFFAKMMDTEFSQKYQ